MAFVVDWMFYNRDQPTIVCAYTVQINVLVLFMVKEKEREKREKKMAGREGREPPPPPPPHPPNYHISAAQLSKSKTDLDIKLSCLSQSTDSLHRRKYIIYILWQWGTTGAEIKVPSVENPELTNVFPLKPGVGQNVVTYASPASTHFFLVLISTFPVHSPSFFQNHLPAF